MVREIRLIGVEGIPEVKKGDDVARLILSCAKQQGTPLSDDDILVVTQKIVSKSEGMVVNLSDISPTGFAQRVGQQLDKDPRLVEVILQQSRRIVRMDKGVLFAETKLGYVCANAGVDAILFNCSQPETISDAIRVAKDVLANSSDERIQNIKVGAYANAFAPQPKDATANDGLDEVRPDLTPDTYTVWVKEWKDMGADMIGGCCGIGVEHIAAIKALGL